MKYSALSAMSSRHNCLPDTLETISWHQLYDCMPPARTSQLAFYTTANRHLYPLDSWGVHSFVQHVRRGQSVSDCMYVLARVVSICEMDVLSRCCFARVSSELCDGVFRWSAPRRFVRGVGCHYIISELVSAMVSRHNPHSDPRRTHVL